MNLQQHAKSQTFSSFCSRDLLNLKIQEHFGPYLRNQDFSKYEIFGQFSAFWGANKIFLESLALSRTTSYRFLAPCQNLEKVNDTIQRKCLDRQMEIWKAGRTDYCWGSKNIGKRPILTQLRKTF